MSQCRVVSGTYETGERGNGSLRKSCDQLFNVPETSSETEALHSILY